MAFINQRQLGPMSSIPANTIQGRSVGQIQAVPPVRQDWGIRETLPAAHHVPRKGYGVAHGAGEPVYHGMPVDLALARLIHQENAADQQAYQASMAGNRNTQLIQAQNDPETYQVAQEYIKAGLPAPQALHLAVTNHAASNGNYLGLGASLPASQKAIDDFSGTRTQLGALFGISAPEVSSGGAFNIKSGNPVRGFTVNADGTADVNTSNGTVKGVKGTNLGTAVGFGTPGPLAKPLQMTAVTAQQLANGTHPIYKKQSSGMFNDRYITKDALGYINQYDKTTNGSLTGGGDINDRTVARDALDYIYKYDKEVEDQKKNGGLNLGVGNLYGVGE